MTRTLRTWIWTRGSGVHHTVQTASRQLLDPVPLDAADRFGLPLIWTASWVSTAEEAAAFARANPEEEKSNRRCALAWHRR